MKELIVHTIDVADVAAEAIPALLDKAGVAFSAIDTVNWADYPYKPQVHFRIARNDSALLFHCRVTEQAVAAVAAADNGNVWEDSCVEFFIMPCDDGIYYNIECNCAGTLLIGAGNSRENREMAPLAVLQSVQRWASLGREPFPHRDVETSWELALVIPFTAMFKHQVATVADKTMRANFYKCGDNLKTPHFLSWSPITAPAPNFHLPDYFGTLRF